MLPRQSEHMGESSPHGRWPLDIQRDQQFVSASTGIGAPGPRDAAATRPVNLNHTTG